MKSTHNAAKLRSSINLVQVALLVSVLSFGTAGCSRDAKVSRHLKRAEQYFKDGEYEKAKIEYLNVLKLDGKSTVAIRQMGLIWSEQGSPIKAIPFLLKARELEPANADVRIKLAYAYGALRQIDEARKEALAAVDQAPGNPDALLFLIDTARTDEDIAVVQKKLQDAGKAGSALDHVAAAQLATRKQDADAVLAALNKAVASDPKSAPAHSALGTHYLRLGKIAEAGAELKIAAEFAPPRSPIRLKYAEFLSLSGKAEEADAWWDSVTKAAPDYFPAWVYRAQDALKKQKYDDALAHLQRVFGSDSTNFDARMLEGQVYLAKGEANKAIEILGNLNNTYPGVPPTKYHLARAHLRAGNVAEAGPLLDQAISAEPNYLEAILLRAEINLRTGNAPAVVNAMTSVLAKNPELGQAQLLLATAYQMTGRPQQALSMVQELARKNPKNSQAQWLLAAVLRKQGNKAEARAAFEKLQSLTPESLVPLSQLVQMAMEDKDFEGALKNVDERLAKEPNSASLLVLKGRIFAVQGNWDRAETELKRAIELDANQATAYQLLCSVYVASGRVPQAIEQMNGLLAKTPDNPQALMISAVLLGETKNMAKSRERYEKLLEKRPDSPAALNNLAWLYAEEFNDLPKARDLARKAQSLRSSDPSIADTLGWILYRSGEYQQALTLIKEASAELGDNPEVLYHLGMANYTMGDEEGARSAFRKAAESKAEFRGKNEIETRLALLDGGEGHGLALDKLLEIVKANPRDTLAWVRLGETHSAAGANPEAAAAYEKAIEINPQLLRAVVRSAELNASLKNPDKALKLVKSALLLTPEDPVVLGRLGKVAYDAGDFSLAYNLLQESGRGKSQNPDLFCNLAWAAYSLGRVPEARDAMQKFVTDSGNNPMTEDGRTFLKMTADGEAGLNVTAADVENQLKAKPAYVPALMLRGASEAKRGDRNSAIQAYTEVLRQYPKFAPAQVRLAALYLQSLETRDQGHELATAALKAMPDDGEAMKTAAESSYHRKEFANVVRLLEGAEKKGALNARELFIFGMSQRGMKRDGKDNLRKAVAAGLQEPDLGEANRALSEKPLANQ